MCPLGVTNERLGQSTMPLTLSFINSQYCFLLLTTYILFCLYLVYFVFVGIVINIIKRAFLIDLQFLNVILVISHFGGTLVLIASVPGHCLPFTFNLMPS